MCTLALAPVTINRQQAHSPVAYVLDDDGKVGALISRMLQASGFVALPFTDPSLCLKQLKTADSYSTPAIIVLDLSLGQLQEAVPGWLLLLLAWKERRRRPAGGSV